MKESEENRTAIQRQFDLIGRRFIIFFISMLFVPQNLFAFNSMDEIFPHEAVQIQMFLLEAAEMAVIKTDDEQIRRFSEELIKFTGELNKKIEKLVMHYPKRKNIDPPVALTEEQLKKMKKLEDASKEKFEQLFLESIKKTFDHLISVYRRELKHGEYDPVLKFVSEHISRIEVYRRRAVALT